MDEAAVTGVCAMVSSMGKASSIAGAGARDSTIGEGAADVVERAMDVTGAGGGAASKAREAEGSR